MSSAARAHQFAEPRRLHPLTMFYKGIVSMPGVIIALYFSARGGEFWLLVLVTIVTIVLTIPAIILRYLYFTFYVTHDEVVVDSGVFSKRSRNIPIERIQNVEMRQNFLQRMFGIAQVQLETAGGDNTEGVFEFISIQDAEALRLLIREQQADHDHELSTQNVKTGAESATSVAGEIKHRAGTPAGEEVLYEMPKRTLWLYGMFRISFWFLAAALTVAQTLGYNPEEFINSHPEQQLLQLNGGEAESLWLIGVLAGLGMLLLAWVSGMLFTVNQFYNFRLTRDRGKLFKQHGLLAVSKATIPLRKVQSMVLSSSPIMRVFGYAALEVQTAGFGQDKRGAEVAVPMAERDKAVELIQEIMQVEVPQEFEPISRLAIRRAFIRMLILWLAVAVGMYFWLGLGALWFALALPLLYKAALLRWEYRGYNISRETAFVRHGFWRRRVSAIPLRKIQTLSMIQSFFQRRLGLASVYIDTAGAGGIDDARIDDVAVEDAERILAEIQQAFNSLHGVVAPETEKEEAATADGGPQVEQSQDGAITPESNAAEGQKDLNNE